MPQRGFTLVELLIGVVIISVLMLLALPSYNQFMAGTRARSTAESLVHGAKLAQMQAIKRNRNVELFIDPAAGWTVRDVDGVIEQEVFKSDAGATVVITPRPGGDMITFDGLGQFRVTNPSDDSDPIRAVAVTSTISPKGYFAVFDPTLGIGMRLCDKDFTYPAEADGCPAGFPY